jgi:general secretion pathway protein B
MAPGAVPAAAPAPLPLVVSAPPVLPAEPPVAAAPLPAAPAATTASPPPPPAASRAPIVTQVRRLADLPPEQRRELPALAVSGSVWSEQPGARFVVLDGQVLREGDRLAPGLVLVKLAPRSATLRWRDGLIEVPF